MDEKIEQSQSLNSLKELEQIEEKILHILQISQDTLHELQNIPHLNIEKINQLSTDYLNLVTEVKTNLQEKSNVIRPYHPYGQGNYSLRREVEIAEAASRLSCQISNSSSNNNQE